jgi:hypothetical protein
MPEKNRYCPDAYRTRAEANAALEKEVRNAKENGLLNTRWGMLKLYQCNFCHEFHIWPRKAPAPSLSVIRAIQPAKPLTESTVETGNGQTTWKQATSTPALHPLLPDTQSNHQ